MSSADQERLTIFCKPITDVLKAKKLPPPPAQWPQTESHITWYSKVNRTFEELKACNVQEFNEICVRLGGELKEDYESIVFQAKGTRFPIFETLHSVIHFNNVVTGTITCDSCAEAGVVCELREAAGNAKAKCTNCVAKKIACSSGFIPRLLWNVRFRTGSSPVTGPSAHQEVVKGPAAEPSDAPKVGPPRKKKHRSDALEAIRMLTTQVEADVAAEVWSLTCDAMEVIDRIPDQHLPRPPPPQ